MWLVLIKSAFTLNLIALNTMGQMSGLKTEEKNTFKLDATHKAIQFQAIIVLKPRKI